MSYFNRFLLSGPLGGSGLFSYEVTPPSINGGVSDSVNHRVTGSPGTTFTFSASGGGVVPTPSTGTIPANGIYDIGATQPAQSSGAPARTLSFTVTNDNNPSNTFSDTVSQSQGLTAVTVTTFNLTGQMAITGTFTNGYTATAPNRTISYPAGVFTTRTLGGPIRDVFNSAACGGGVSTFTGFSSNATLPSARPANGTASFSQSASSAFSGTVGGSWGVNAQPCADDPQYNVAWGMTAFVAPGYIVNGSTSVVALYSCNGNVQL